MSRIDRKSTWEAKNKAFWLLVAGEIQQAVANRLAVSVLTDRESWGKGKGVRSIAERKRLLRSTKLTGISKSVLTKSLSEKRYLMLRLVAGLTAMGHWWSKDYVWRYITIQLYDRACLRPEIPKFSPFDAYQIPQFNRNHQSCRK